MDAIATSGYTGAVVSGPAITIDGWIYPRTNSAALYFGKTNAGSSPYGIRYDAGGHVHVFITTTAGVQDYDTGYTPTLNAWTYLALVYDANSTVNSHQVFFYANGNPVFEDSKTGTGNVQFSSPVDFTIGNEMNSANPSFDGLIDDVKVFAGALNLGEIQGSCTP